MGSKKKIFKSRKTWFCDILRFFIFLDGISVWKMSKNCSKIANFRFLINRPIWPILMIGKLYKVSMGHFRPNPRYWADNGWNRWKIVFLAVRWPFLAFFEKSKNQFFVEYSTGVEISTVKFSEKKLMMFLDIHHKYLGLILIT